MKKNRRLLITILIMAAIIGIVLIVGLLQFFRNRNTISIPSPAEDVIYQTTYGKDIKDNTQTSDIEMVNPNTEDSHSAEQETKTIRVKYQVKAFQNDAVIVFEYINVNTPIISASLFNESGSIVYTPDETLIKNPGTIVFRVPNLYAGEWTAAITIDANDDVGKVLAYAQREEDYITTHSPSEVPHDNNYEWEVEHGWYDEDGNLKEDATIVVPPDEMDTPIEEMQEEEEPYEE